MTKRNANLYNLQDTYLFPRVRQYKEALLKKNPHAHIISLSIGDTTEPIPPHITQGLIKTANGLGTPEGYSGYGPEQGVQLLREKIAKVFYPPHIEPDEIFVSDGAKCDIARLQLLFGNESSAAIQDPTYPVYVDTSLLIGKNQIVYMPCTKENGFFPNLNEIERTDLIFFCSPNNPTGATATKAELKNLVDFAIHNRSIIIFDAAYNHYIQDPHLPKSIYEIEGADRVAIEIGSFSKLIGFTGVRLAWSVVPKALTYECGSSIHKDWNRIMTTCFNGASIISQGGALAALDEQGLQEMRSLIGYYMENTRLLKEALTPSFEVYGGDDIPYLWTYVKKNSWDAFHELLEDLYIVTTPGCGFGACGEGYLRFSAFAHREDLQQAIDRLKSRTHIRDRLTIN